MFYLFADSEHESDEEPQAEPDLDPLQLAENRARQFIESKKNQNNHKPDCWGSDTPWAKGPTNFYKSARSDYVLNQFCPLSK